MNDSDSMTKRLMERICDRRASFASKLILRAAVRAAIDLTCSGENIVNDLYDSEQLLNEAFSCVTNTGET